MKLTDTEWQVMNALWEGYPATARQIGQRLPADVTWAYTTLKTMLTRLVKKGAVSEHKQANTSVYEPLISREGARRSALRSLAESAFEGAFGSLMHFLVQEQNLTPRQRKQLLKALEDDSKTRTKRKGEKK